ncbi:MAG: DNA polymerase III subunit psi [Bdellovibrionales bacterium]|nr:DNA polymerase III subunit psi [Bdellovibrionales bacterium]
MQMRELFKKQYTYLREVLGVEAIVMPPLVNELEYTNLVLLSAPLSAEERGLLEKITQAFGWSSYDAITADELHGIAKAKQTFIFGDEAKRCADKYVKTLDAILAPSLAILLHDAKAKKLLWQQMKQYMEA